ncbi:MAG: hypothetical protein JXK94_03530 [Deltaproteobacteria bacterium]|nr:hypothetical protein [Deltaproteobacteria bacterium]
MKKLWNFNILKFVLSSTAVLMLAVPPPCQAVNATNTAFAKRLSIDIRAIQASRQGLKTTLEYIDAHPDIFPPTKLKDGRLLNREERLIVWQTWQTLLDHVLFCDALGQEYSEIYMLAEEEEKKKESAFFIALASFLAEYRFALDFIERMERNPAMHVMLNEAVPELGLEQGTYALFKFRFLNALRGAEFARLNIVYKNYADKENHPLKSMIDEDNRAIWQAGQGKGPTMTVVNAVRIVKDLGFTAWFPVQKNVSKLMGNIKVWRLEKTFVSPEQIKKLQKKLQPGDILLQRREWYASNIGIPGFWAHAALYIGGPEEREQFFSDPLVVEWLAAQGSEGGSLESLLRKRYPDKYKLSKAPREDHHRPRVLEAIGEGVSFTTLEHSAAADSLAVLRPRLSKNAKAQAIIRAFHYSGRPYDFNFDFQTDSELVCSELIYKAYEKSDSHEGLSLATKEVLGRKIISPNDIAQLFDQEYGQEKRQFEFIAFLDGDEGEHQAVEKDVETFRTSWKRPKWHILTQELKDISLRNK